MKDIDARKVEILEIAQKITVIPTISKSDAVISSNSINVDLNETYLVIRIASFGSISGDAIARLVSVVDGGVFNVVLKIKL